MGLRGRRVRPRGDERAAAAGRRPGRQSRYLAATATRGRRHGPWAAKGLEICLFAQDYVDGGNSINDKKKA